MKPSKRRKCRAPHLSSVRFDTLCGNGKPWRFRQINYNLQTTQNRTRSNSIHSAATVRLQIFESRGQSIVLYYIIVIELLYAHTGTPILMEKTALKENFHYRTVSHGYVYIRSARCTPYANK